MLRQFYTTARRGNPYEIVAGRHFLSLKNILFWLMQVRSLKKKQNRIDCVVTMMSNLPGWRWARIKQLALVGSSSSLHSEACKALGDSSGAVHSKISVCDISRSRGCQTA